MQKLIWLWLTLIWVCLLSACGSGLKQLEPETVDSQDEAAAVMFSVTSLAPWHLVMNGLKTNYTLTADEALKQVLPGTRFTQSKQRSDTKISGSFSNNRPGPGTMPATSAVSDAPPLEGNAEGFSNPDKLGVSPFLKIKQMVDLLQFTDSKVHEIERAAVKNCYVPYLVGAKLTVDTHRLKLGYNINTHISFFKNQVENKHPGEPVDRKASDCNNAEQTPKILPILATDDLERTIALDSSEVTRQIAGSLAAVYSTIGGQLAAQQTNQSFISVLSSNYNSRLQIGRESNNTLNVRIGATNQAVKDGALIPQTYDLTLLLLIPQSYFDKYPYSESDISGPEISTITYSEFRNTQSGEVLSSRPPENAVIRFDGILKTFFLGIDEKDLYQDWTAYSEEEKLKTTIKITSYIKRDDYCEFANDLFKTPDDGNYPQCNHKNYQPERDSNSLAWKLFHNIHRNFAISLWAEASAVLADGAFRSHSFQVNLPQPIHIPEQTAVLSADKDGKAAINLYNVKGNDFSFVQANLKVTPKKPGETQDLQAQVAFDDVNKILVLTFPSLSADTITSYGKTATLTISNADCTPETVCPAMHNKDFKVWLVPAVKANPAPKPAPAPATVIKPKAVPTKEEPTTP